MARREPAGKAARPATLAKPDLDFSLTDTIADLGRSTVKGPPPIPARDRASEGSGSKIGRKIREAKQLPVAQPLENGPASEFVIPIDDLLSASRPHSPAPAVTARANGRLSPAPQEPRARLGMARLRRPWSSGSPAC